MLETIWTWEPPAWLSFIAALTMGYGMAYTKIVLWRNFKVKHRYKLKFNERITDDNHTLQAMVMSARIEVARLTALVNKQLDEIKQLRNKETKDGVQN